jgi:hypothetical protein
MENQWTARLIWLALNALKNKEKMRQSGVEGDGKSGDNPECHMFPMM